MAIVTVKNKYQVVIPHAIREKLGINRGDVLEARVERGRLTYVPKTILDRVPAGRVERAQFLKQLRDEAPGWLQEIWKASKRHGTDKLTARQINAEIAAVRSQSTQKNKRPAK